MAMDFKRQSLLDAVAATEKAFKNTQGKAGHQAAYHALQAAKLALAKYDGVPHRRASTVHPHHHNTDRQEEN